MQIFDYMKVFAFGTSQQIMGKNEKFNKLNILKKYK